MDTYYKSILITGGAGFIGSHFIRYWLKKYPKPNVINFDLLTYAANLSNLDDIKNNPRYKFIKGDIGDYKIVRQALKNNKIDLVVNFAAESDNNKAVKSPIDFTKTNAFGTAVLIEACRQNSVKRFHHISTCEVYGQLSLTSQSKFSESSPLQPRTPYNASKASADHITRSYYHTFRFPVTISNCANNYGTHQFPEKVIPVFTIKALKNKPLPLFESVKNKREWIHVLDHCSGIDLVLQKGKIGETYNIGTGLEKSISEIADEILSILDKPKTLKKIIPDRPGHDTRYLLDSSKIRKLGWRSKVTWQKGFPETVLWYKSNPQWWSPILSKSNS